MVLVLAIAAGNTILSETFALQTEGS